MSLTQINTALRGSSGRFHNVFLLFQDFLVRCVTGIVEKADGNDFPVLHQPGGCNRSTKLNKNERQILNNLSNIYILPIHKVPLKSKVPSLKATAVISPHPVSAVKPEKADMEV